jgi:hypothetical protein
MVLYVFGDNRLKITSHFHTPQLWESQCPNTKVVTCQALHLSHMIKSQSFFFFLENPRNCVSHTLTSLSVSSLVQLIVSLPIYYVFSFTNRLTS